MKHIFITYDQNIQINKGKEFGLLSIESPGAQWSLLVNGSWRYLGSELSALLETAWQNGEAALNAAHFLKVCFIILYYKENTRKLNFQVDLKQMTSTSPIYAPIKRVSIPAVTTSMKLQERRVTVKLALSNLKIQTNSGQVMYVEKPYMQVKKFLSNDWRTIENMDLEIERIHFDTKMFEHLEALQKFLKGSKLTSSDENRMTINRIKTSSVNLSINYSQLYTTGDFFTQFTKQYEKIRSV